MFSLSGTTLVASQQSNRKWIGIDSSKHAIKVTRKKLSKIAGTLYNPKVEYSLFVEEGYSME